MVLAMSLKNIELKSSENCWIRKIRQERLQKYLVEFNIVPINSISCVLQTIASMDLSWSNPSEIVEIVKAVATDYQELNINGKQHIGQNSWVNYILNKRKYNLDAIQA